MSSIEVTTPAAAAKKFYSPSEVVQDPETGGKGLNTVDLIEFASDAAFAIDDHMRVIGWNSAAEDMMGYTPAEVIGISCGRVLQAFYPTGEPLCSVLCEGRACFDVGEKWKVGACRIRHMDGQMITVSISTMVLPLNRRSKNPDDAVAVVFMRESTGVTEEISSVQPLRIFTLGRFDLAVNGGGLDVDSWKRKQAVVLLKILVGQLGRPVHRERLIEWLWPDVDADSGWKRLKVVVSFLRDKLRVGGAPKEIIETVGESYSLRRDAVWIDSVVFESLVSAGAKLMKEGSRREAQARFEEAASLYRGDYLEDMPYVDWCAEERGRLREVYLELLSGMIKCYADQSLFMEAVQICRTALVNDPCRESFFRAMMENLVNLGRADWAEREFVTWRRVLEEEYDLQPTRETLQAYQRIVDGQGRS